MDAIKSRSKTRARILNVLAAAPATAAELTIVHGIKCKAAARNAYLAELVAEGMIERFRRPTARVGCVDTAYRLAAKGTR